MKRKNIDAELDKYRKLIDNNYIDEDENNDIDYDILKFCARKKAVKDLKYYGKIRPTYFDDKLEMKKKRN